METEVCTQPVSPEERFLQALIGCEWVQFVDSMKAEERATLASRSEALIGEELDALELVGRLANTMQDGCDDAIDVTKVGAVVTAMARRMKLYREVSRTVKALADFERVHDPRASASAGGPRG